MLERQKKNIEIKVQKKVQVRTWRLKAQMKRVYMKHEIVAMRVDLTLLIMMNLFRKSLNFFKKKI